MPAILAMFIGMLASAASSIAGRVLLFMGIGFISYKGMDKLITKVFEYSMANFDTLPATIIGIMGLMKVDVMIAIFTSGVFSSMIMSGLTGGVLTKMITK